MSARFRIRTPQGQELSFASEEMFAHFVESGELSDGDLVYDASTGEWSPALTHTVVLEIQSASNPTSGPRDEVRREDAVAPTGGAAPDEHPSEPAPASKGGDLGFELAPEQTPEEASAAFVKEMQEERASEFERSVDGGGLRAEESGRDLLRDIQHEPPKPPETSPYGEAATSRGVPAGASGTRPSRKPPKRSRSQRFRDAGNRRSVSGTFLIWILALGAFGIAGLFGPDILALVGSGEGEEEGVSADAPVLPDTEEAIEARAEVRFLGAMRPRLIALPPIPSIWLDGMYLANASQYPEVAEAWLAYLEEVSAVRARENELYSEAYLSALDDARVTGATRTLRLASALSRFEREGQERTQHYERVEELVLAALDLHDLLLDRESMITYEPAVGSRVSADPILQAAGSDPETQAMIEETLDRVLDALSARGFGPVEARALPAWVFEGLRDAVAPE